MTTSDGKGGEVKMFPIQRSYNRGVPAYPMLIPWSVAELAYSVYASQNGTGQSLVRLGERGGFGPEEMDELLPGWRERCDTINTLSTTIAELRAQVEGLQREVKDQAKLIRIHELAAPYHEDMDNELDAALMALHDPHAANTGVTIGRAITAARKCIAALHSTVERSASEKRALERAWAAQVEGLRERVKCEAAEVDTWRHLWSTVDGHDWECDETIYEKVVAMGPATAAARLAAKGEK